MKEKIEDLLDDNEMFTTPDTSIVDAFVAKDFDTVDSLIHQRLVDLVRDRLNKEKS